MANPHPRSGTRSRILILGAGIYQLPLIQRAKQMGFETHVVSYAGDFPGIVIADHFHELDTTDIPGVVALAKRIKVDAVVTSGADVCVPTVGAVCDALGLPGITRGVAELISSKDTFRTFQSANGMHAPRFTIIEERTQLPIALATLRPPLILKPVDSSGSRGIVRIETSALDRAGDSFDYARAFSRCGRVCIEEVLPGIEVGGNALLYEGRVVFLAITAKHMERFLVRGHSYPCNIGPLQQKAVRREIELACALLNYRNGALNFDVMVHGEEATIIEFGARLGGNGLTDLIAHAFDYDIENDILRLALGDAPKVPEAREVRPCGSWVFGVSCRGHLEKTSTLDELRKTVPEAYAISHASSAGAPVQPFVHNANQLGYVLFSIPPGETWLDMAGRLQDSFVIDVSPAGS